MYCVRQRLVRNVSYIKRVLQSSNCSLDGMCLLPQKPFYRQKLCLGFSHTNSNVFKNLVASVKTFSTLADNSITEPLSSSKVHRELENESFHLYLSNNPNYSRTIHKFVDFKEETVSEQEFNDIINVTNWEGESVDKFHYSFMKAGLYASRVLKVPISNDKFTALSAGFVVKCTHFSDKQLIDIFTCLYFWPESQGVKADNFLNVWKTLDYACVLRRSQWDMNMLLYMCDLWFGIRLARLSLFVMKTFDKFLKKSKRLTEHNLVQIFFYLNILRKVPRDTSLYEFEYYLNDVIDKLHIEEIGIVASGFFKAQKKLSTKTIIQQMIIQLTKHHDDADVMTLGAILKLIRYTGKEDHIPAVITLLDTLAPKMGQWTLQVNTHLALTSIEGNINHALCATNFMEQFIAAPHNARLKDMEKLALLIGKFKYDSKLATLVCEHILSELKKPTRQDELAIRPKSLVRCMSNLASARVFDNELISRVLDENFLNDTYEKNYTIDREVLLLDSLVEFDFPEYKGNRLSPKLFNYLCKRFCTVIPEQVFNEKKHDRLLMDFFATMRQLCDKPSYWTAKYVLPHHNRPDVILNVDNNMKLKEIPSEIIKQNNFTGNMIPPSNVRLFCLVVGSKPMFSYQENILLGEYDIKLRQLERVGYIPVLIPYYEWINLQGFDQKAQYIYKKLEFAKEDRGFCENSNV